MGRRKQVCKNCRRFTTEKVCPSCKSTNLSTSWKGMVIIVNTDSEVSKMLNIEEPGKYTLYVG
jgi:RNA polymerase subunit RPABC4/transcription elongation factor Spt4